MNMRANTDQSTDRNPAGDAWEKLATQWRDVPATVIPLDTLSRVVKRRIRWMRWWHRFELLLLALAIGMSVRAALPTREAMPPGVLLLVVLFLLGYQGWSMWNRRRLTRDITQDVRTMVAWELERIDASLRYWRVSIWLALLLLCAAWMILLSGPASSAAIAEKAAIALLVNLPILLGWAVFAWWWGRRNRTRRALLQVLQFELDAD